MCFHMDIVHLAKLNSIIVHFDRLTYLLKKHLIKINYQRLLVKKDILPLRSQKNWAEIAKLLNNSAIAPLFEVLLPSIYIR